MKNLNANLFLAVAFSSMFIFSIGCLGDSKTKELGHGEHGEGEHLEGEHHEGEHHEGEHHEGEHLEGEHLEGEHHEGEHHEGDGHDAGEKGHPAKDGDEHVLSTEQLLEHVQNPGDFAFPKNKGETGQTGYIAGN